MINNPISRDLAGTPPPLPLAAVRDTTAPIRLFISHTAASDRADPDKPHESNKKHVMVKSHLHAPPLVFGHHRDWVRSVAVSADGRIVASASDDMTVRLCTAAGECTLSYTIPSHCPILDGKDTGAYQRNAIRSVAISEDGAVVAFGADDTLVRVRRPMANPLDLAGHSQRIKGVAVSADGLLAASASDDKTVRIWNLERGTCARVLVGHTNYVESVAISADKSFIVSASADNTVRAWSVQTGRCTQTIKGHADWVMSVAISDDMLFCASASADKTVRVWMLATGECVQILSGHTGWVRSVAISKDGAFIVSASDDKTVRVWSVAAGECVCVLDGDLYEVFSVAIPSDMSIIASASQNNVVRVWPTRFIFDALAVGRDRKAKRIRLSNQPDE